MAADARQIIQQFIASLEQQGATYVKQMTGEKKSVNHM
jgi:hypothetical protein